MLFQAIVGQQTGQSMASGTTGNLRLGQLNDLIVSELHGRFYEANYRNNLFSFASTLTPLVAANAVATGLTATAQPVIGIYNPSTSQVNLNVLQATVMLQANNLTSGVAPGALVWVTSTGQTAISTGSVPFNNKTLAYAGSQAKAFSLGTALTGLVGSLNVYGATEIPNATALTYTTLASTSIIPSTGGVINVDGSFIVPPGGFLGIMNTTASTTFSALAKILWEEIPV